MIPKKTIVGLMATASIMGGVDASTLNETLIQRIETVADYRIEAKQVGNRVETNFPWKDQTPIKVSYDMGEPTVAERFKDQRNKEVITDTVDFGDGGFKIDVLLNEKPNTNVFCYDIQNAENYDFFYQPPLTAKEIEEGASRPPEIEGSYAVYHKTLANHVIGKENYATGKVMHIPRPQVWELGNEEATKEWADLSYENGQLCVTARQEFLDKANYPVRVDPTFGYTSAGSSNYSLAVGNATAGSRESWRKGGEYVSPANATLNSISAYTVANTSNSFDLYMAVNTKDSVASNQHGLVAKVTSNNVPHTTTPSWQTLNLAGETISSSTTYVLSVAGNGSDLGASSFGNIRFDSVSNQLYEAQSNGASGFTTVTSDTWTVTPFTDTVKISIYATYTVIEDAPPFTENFEGNSTITDEFDTNDSYNTGDFALDTTSVVNGVNSARCDIGAPNDGCVLTETVASSTELYTQMTIFLPTGWAVGGSGYLSLWGFGDGTGNPVYCKLEDYGSVRLICDGDELAYTDTGINIPLNTKTTLEFRVKISTTEGDLDIWANNSSANLPTYNGSGFLNTGNQQISSFYIGGYHPDIVNDMYYDDIYISRGFIGIPSYFPSTLKGGLQVKGGVIIR